MPIFRRRRTWIFAGAAAILVGVWAWSLLFRPFDAPPAPEQFDQVAGVMPFIDVTFEAGFTHVHHKPYLDAKLEPAMPSMCRAAIQRRLTAGAHLLCAGLLCEHIN